jgi:hypothetical protein
MEKQYEMVRVVHEKFGSPVAKIPQFLDAGTRYDALYAAGELDSTSRKMKAAGAAGFGGQVVARGSWMVEELVEFLRAENVADQADALIDLIYFAIGTFVEMGINPEPLFSIVNEANMGKLWEDGKPRFDPQGKWIKPPWWAEKFAPEPRIRAEIERQRAAAKERPCMICRGAKCANCMGPDWKPEPPKLVFVPEPEKHGRGCSCWECYMI